MISRYAKYALCALLPLTCATTAMAVPPSESEITECDRLAADPDDPNRVTRSVGMRRMRAVAALKACQSAFDNDPTNLRLTHQYGRALLANDRMEGLEILTATAEKGYLASQILLAEFHWRFTSPQRDREKSFKWYLRAAENGDFPSLALAAGMLIEGLGVAKDPGRALRMLEKGAAEGNLWAHASLGNLLRSGRYVPRDEDRAYLHLRLAADNFNTTAMFPLGLFLIKTSGKYRNVARGVELLEAAARRGSFAAPFFLGDLYREGKHLPKDDEKMTFWFCRIGQEGKKILEEHFGHEPECDE